jgi:hypothetical protein
MFTKILPACDLFNYIKGPKDSKGVDREEPAVRIRGNDAVMTRLLVAQAAFGVRPKKPRIRARLPMRSHTEWVRHCQGHLVHIINCFHETDERISPALAQITPATENLILLGLPKDALHFTWYRHSQEKGTHSHGGMGRILLHSGKPYEPKLGQPLRQRFDRLVSRRFGFFDPVDPHGFQIVRGGRGSWRPENFDIIIGVCQEATKRWRDNKLTKRGEFATLLGEFGFTVVFEPDAFGRPVLQPKAAGIAAPCYPNTVVARREDTGGIIVFCGPACRGDFTAGPWRERVEARAKAAADLRLFPYQVFAEFERYAIQRFQQQRAESSHVTAGRCVSIKDFEWLKPGSKRWEEPKEVGRLTETDVFSPDRYWGDRLSPFVSDVDPELDDVTDPIQAPLREWIEEEYATLAAGEAELDENPAPAAGPSEPEAPPADPPEPPNETPAPENETPALPNEIRSPSVKQPEAAAPSSRHAVEQTSESIVSAFYRPDNALSRRRLQLEICRGIARQREKHRRVKKKMEQTQQTHEKGAPISPEKKPAYNRIQPVVRTLLRIFGLGGDEKPTGLGGASATVNKPNNPPPKTSEPPRKTSEPPPKPKEREIEPSKDEPPREDVQPPDISI